MSQMRWGSCIWRSQLIPCSYPQKCNKRGQDSSALGVASHGAVSASGREHQCLLFLSPLPSPPHPCRQHWVNQDSLEVLEHWTAEDPHLLLGSCLSVSWHCIFREQRMTSLLPSTLALSWFPKIPFHFTRRNSLGFSKSDVHYAGGHDRAVRCAAGRYCGMTA